MMNSTTVKLKKIIKRGDKKVAEIIIREPTGGELRGVNLADVLQMDVDAVCRVLERVTEPMLDRAAFAAMNAEDLTSLSVGLVSFFVDTSSFQT